MHFSDLLQLHLRPIAGLKVRHVVHPLHLYNQFLPDPIRLHPLQHLHLPGHPLVRLHHILVGVHQKVVVHGDAEVQLVQGLLNKDGFFEEFTWEWRGEQCEWGHNGQVGAFLLLGHEADKAWKTVIL